jgi:hypothetical protein
MKMKSVAIRKQDNEVYARSRALSFFGDKFSFIVYDMKTGRTLASCRTQTEAVQIAAELTCNHGTDVIE